MDIWFGAVNLASRLASMRDEMESRFQFAYRPKVYAGWWPKDSTERQKFRMIKE